MPEISTVRLMYTRRDKSVNVNSSAGVPFGAEKAQGIPELPSKSPSNVVKRSVRESRILAPKRNCKEPGMESERGVRDQPGAESVLDCGRRTRRFFLEGPCPGCNGADLARQGWGARSDDALAKWGPEPGGRTRPYARSSPKAAAPGSGAERYLLNCHPLARDTIIPHPARRLQASTGPHRPLR